MMNSAGSGTRNQPKNVFKGKLNKASFHFLPKNLAINEEKPGLVQLTLKTHFSTAALPKPDPSLMMTHIYKRCFKNMLLQILSEIPKTKIIKSSNSSNSSVTN